MAGVASPMLRRSRASGVRFLSGLAAGNLVAALLLALLLNLAGEALVHAVPLAVREVLVAVLALAFAVADVLNRTPHIWRQVPQRFIWSLQPGTLGVVWGFDLGLLVTTQKTSSLIWFALAAITLLTPSSAVVALIGFSVVWMVGTVIWTLAPWATDIGRRLGRTWMRPLRWVTGGAIVALGVGIPLHQLLG